MSICFKAPTVNDVIESELKESSRIHFTTDLIRYPAVKEEHELNASLVAKKLNEAFERGLWSAEGIEIAALPRAMIHIDVIHLLRRHYLGGDWQCFTKPNGDIPVPGVGLDSIVISPHD